MHASELRFSVALVAVAALASAVAGCLKLDAQGGFKCSADGGQCPSPYQCRASDNTCWLPGDDGGAGHGAGGGGRGAAGGASGAGGRAGAGGTAGTGTGGTAGTGGASGTGTGGAGGTGTGGAGGTGTGGMGGAGGRAGAGGTSGAGGIGTGGTGGRAGAGGAAGAGGGTAGTGGKLGSGGHCTLAAECASGANCVEGVCCNSACSTKCSSCLFVNTGQPDGTCALVHAGTAHGSDCAASNASTCGFDGTCDGSGACRKFASGTICKVQSCPTGSTYTPASTCNGTGTCSTGNAVSCANYACDPSAAICRTTCSVNSDCSTVAYCNGGTCTAKKGAGQLCTAAAECASGVCGGRCCDAGTTCNCPQPSVGNQLKNPGFDTDLSSWILNLGDGRILWDSNDVECPFSGSARLLLANGSVNPVISQCVSVSPSSLYNVGAAMQAGGGGYTYCNVDLFPAAGCSGTGVSGFSVPWLNVSWSSQSGMVQTLPNTVSVRFYCYSDGINSLNIDEVFLALVPGAF